MDAYQRGEVAALWDAMRSLAEQPMELTLVSGRGWVRRR